MNEKIIEYLKDYVNLLEDKLFFLNCKDMWNNDDYQKSRYLDNRIREVKTLIESEGNEKF